jgi:hypothetical protein
MMFSIMKWGEITIFLQKDPGEGKELVFHGSPGSKEHQLQVGL